MACPFLDKLAPELRKQIYEHLLDYERTYLRHATQLQPFLKKLTGVNGSLPFEVADQSARRPSSCIDTGILSTSKLVYNEAIRVFYDLNTISVDVELFRLAGLTTPTGSDLFLARSQVVKFNESGSNTKQQSRSHNTINLQTFLPRLHAMFPTLRDILIRTDGASRPSTSLLDIAHACVVSNDLRDVHFDRVGSFAATSHRDVAIRVECRRLVDTWLYCDSMDEEETLNAMQTTYSPVRGQSLAQYVVYRAYMDRLTYQQAHGKYRIRFETLLEDFQERMLPNCPSFATDCGLDNLELWTAYAGRYRAYPRED